MVSDRTPSVLRLVYSHLGGEYKDDGAYAYRKDAHRIEPGLNEGLEKSAN